jgi:hypothetical protein
LHCSCGCTPVPLCGRGELMHRHAYTRKGQSWRTNTRHVGGCSGALTGQHSAAGGCSRSEHSYECPGACCSCQHCRSLHPQSTRLYNSAWCLHITISQEHCVQGGRP